MFTYLDNLYIDILGYWTNDQLTVTRNSYQCINQIVIQNSEDIICVVNRSTSKELTFSCELLKPHSRQVLAHCEMSMSKINMADQFNFRNANGKIVTLDSEPAAGYIITKIQDIFAEYEYQAALNK